MSSQAYEAIVEKGPAKSRNRPYCFLFEPW